MIVTPKKQANQSKMCQFYLCHTFTIFSLIYDYNEYITKRFFNFMSKEMLFLCDVYDKWLDQNELPHWSACDILYGQNACKLTGNQKYWLESFISTWDIINQTT